MGGGKIILSGVTFNVDNSAGTYPLYLAGHDDSYNWDVTIDNCRFNTKNYIYIYGYSGTTPCDNNFLRQGNIIIKRETNNIGTFAGILNNNYLGLGQNKVMRTIEGFGPPGSLPGFISKNGDYFDRYKDITNPSKPVHYKCISMQPFGWKNYIP